ncbi:hypothetical protein [Streptomyces cyaneofuscatus]|uniref:hypothetical protein n=1 Tax=Streptomyces cyaneofuscatus TaxID=66883 RepID=UPI003663085B
MNSTGTVAGIWDLSIATPIGKISAVIELRDEDGSLTGTARGAGEEVPLDGLLLTGGDRLTWKQAVTRPMRLNLAFDVTVTGDTLAGTSKAGRLPASRVSGRRRTDGPAEAASERRS